MFSYLQSALLSTKETENPAQFEEGYDRPLSEGTFLNRIIQDLINDYINLEQYLMKQYIKQVITLAVHKWRHRFVFFGWWGPPPPKKKQMSLPYFTEITAETSNVTFFRVHPPSAKKKNDDVTRLNSSLGIPSQSPVSGHWKRCCTGRPGLQLRRWWYVQGLKTCRKTVNQTAGEGEGTKKFWRYGMI